MRSVLPARALTAIVGLAAALVVAGCTFLNGGTPAPTGTPTPTPSPAPAGPLVSIELRGGMCIDGQCGSIVVLNTDGTVTTAAKPPNELGTVPAEDVAGLTELIARTDFDAIRAVPFTGTCPMAFDGQEAVYEFTTADGVERIESCVTAVDLRHPLFAAAAAVLEDFIQIPVYDT